MTMGLELSELAGLYILTGKGRLGYFDENKAFVVDTVLSQKFAEHNTRFIQSYLRNPDEPGLRLALIYRSRQPRKWGALTMVLTDATLRKLYPASRARLDELTDFQLRNHDKSIYRGIELFLDYHIETEPDTPIFCPVCVNRNTTLDHYASSCHVDHVDVQAKTPVVEVVNLVGNIPVGRRNSSEIWKLHKSIYNHAVKKNLRKPVEMELLESARKHSSGSSIGVKSNDTFGFEDRRSEREITLGSQDNSTKIRRVTENDENVDTKLLKTFVKFNGLDGDRLTRLAAHSPVLSAPPGSLLFSRGSGDNWNYYLLEGIIQLEAKDGGTVRIEAGTTRARAEIANLKPRMYTVTAITPIKYLRIDSAFETEILRTESSDGLELI
jgi:hypothetical protein